jgi:hypothetical protein
MLWEEAERKAAVALGGEQRGGINDIKLDRGREFLASRDEDWRFLWW